MIWDKQKLGDIADLSIGKTPSRGNQKLWDKEKITKNIWVSIADLTSSSGLFIKDSKEYISDEGAKLFKPIPSGTLVMSFKLSIGKLSITKCELRTNEAIVALPIKDEKLISKKYLFYFLSSINWYALAGNDIKVKGMTLNKAKLKEILISYPPLEQQKKIVSNLDNSFSEIDKSIFDLQKKINELEKLKLLCLKKSFNQIAKKWENVFLGDICDLVGGGTPSKNKPEYYGGDIPWATVRDMNFDELSITDHKITKLGLKNSSSNIIPKNNLIIASRVGLGKVCILNQDTAINQDLRGVIPKNGIDLDRRFLFYWFKDIANQIISAGTGLTVKGVKLPFLNSLSLPKPPLKIQKNIGIKLDSIFNEVNIAGDATEQMIDKYIALKSSLLVKEIRQNIP